MRQGSGENQIEAYPMDDKRFRSDRGRDPIAEIARLIAQGETHEESAPSDNRFREEIVSDGYDETPELPPAAQLTVDLNEYEQACECDEHCSGDQTYDVDDQPFPAEEEHQDNEVPRVRRHSLTLVMAIFGLALVGTACAIGYRDIFDGSRSPGLPPTIKAINETNRIASAPSEPQTESRGNAGQVRPATTGSIDNMVSRQQPTSHNWVHESRRARFATAGERARYAGHRSRGTETSGAARGGCRSSCGSRNHCRCPAAPRPIGWHGHTAASNHEHLTAVPVAHANADGSAAVTAPVVASGYSVQVTSERSESRAQAAFRALQAKYPNQLSGHQPIIHRADLGAAGIFYRALVGPFASADKAAKICSGLKAAGGDCIIQKIVRLRIGRSC